MVPTNGAVSTDVSDLEAIGVDERRDLVGHWPRRWGIAGSGSLLVQGFVGTLVVELVAEGVEPALLGTQAASRRPCGLGLEGAMHAFMSSVLLRLAGLDKLWEHAEADPPRGERREASQGVGGEGNAVVGADPDGETEFLEETGENRFRPRNSRGMETLAAEEIAAVAIGDGEWVAINSVAGFKLAFEISTPDIVRSQDRAGGFARMPDPASISSNGNHAAALQDVLNGSPCRKTPSWMALMNDFEELFPAPGWVMAAEFEKSFNNLGIGLIG